MGSERDDADDDAALASAAPSPTRVGLLLSRSRGYTLIELVVTLFVLALVVGLTVPTIGRSTETVRARAEVARFAAMLRHAREQAITTRRPYSVVIDPQANRVTIREGESEIRDTRTLADGFMIHASSPAALTVRFGAEGVSSGGDFRVTSGSVTYRVTVDPLTGRVRSERQ